MRSRRSFIAIGALALWVVIAVADSLLQWQNRSLIGQSFSPTLTFVAMSLVFSVVGSGSNIAWGIFFSTLMFGIPLSIGAAILRYRLYDIDRIISRTFSYALITAVLAGVYVGSVYVFGGLVRRVTGGSSLGVAASVLVVAALFRPIQRRVQNVVDRRFNRARYDAARTIESFTARLRDETELETLTVDLQDIVRNTMQPAHVTVWMRPKG